MISIREHKDNIFKIKSKKVLVVPSREIRFADIILEIDHTWRVMSKIIIHPYQWTSKGWSF